VRSLSRDLVSAAGLMLARLFSPMAEANGGDLPGIAPATSQMPDLRAGQGREFGRRKCKLQQCRAVQPWSDAGGVSSSRGILCELRGRLGTGPRPPPTPMRAPRTGLLRSIAIGPAVHAAPTCGSQFAHHLGRTGGHFCEIYHDVSGPRLQEARQVLAHAAKELHAYLPADHDQCMIVSQLTRHDGWLGRGRLGHPEWGCGRRSGSAGLREATQSVGIGLIMHRPDPFLRVSVANGVSGTPHADIRQERPTASFARTRSQRPRRRTRAAHVFSECARANWHTLSSSRVHGWHRDTPAPLASLPRPKRTCASTGNTVSATS
jgi:hypothetical protein